MQSSYVATEFQVATASIELSVPTEPGTGAVSSHPARNSSRQVGIRLDHHSPTSWRWLRLEAALGRLQSRIWKHHLRLLARLGETPSSDH